jgi:hypothetical protein
MIENYHEPLIIQPTYVPHTINLIGIPQPQLQNEVIFQELPRTPLQHSNLWANVFQNHHDEDPFDHMDDANIFVQDEYNSLIKN